MILVSVIIPVYNAAVHLDKCIQSLVQQTLTDCEFIFINDGSSDGSQRIIEDFQKKDSRIVLVNQENKGVSAARNVGISMAKGGCLGFVDADDFVEHDFFQTLFSVIQNTKAQIVTSNFNTEIDGQLIRNNPLFETDRLFLSSEIKQQIVPFFLEQDLMNTACNKLYDRKLISNHQLLFPVGVTNGEDGMFNIQAFYHSESVYFINYNGYYYREVANSATRNLQKNDYFKHALDQYALDYTEKFGVSFQDIDVPFLKSKRLINSVFSLIYIYLNPDNSLTSSYKKSYVRQMVSNNLVQTVVRNYWDNFYNGQSKYHKFILHCIKLQSVFGLYLATTYSNFRNKNSIK